MIDPRLGDLGRHEPARAFQHDLHRAREDLGAFHRTPRPEQCLRRTCRNRGDQVDLWEGFAAAQHGRGHRSADHPHILGGRRGRPDRIVAGDHHSGAAALEHVDALVTRNEVQAQCDRPLDRLQTVEARPHRPLAFGSLGSRHERQRPHPLVVRRPAGEPRARRVPVLAERRVFEHAAAVRVGEAHSPRPRGEQQAGHARATLGIDLHRVDTVVLQSTEDHVDRFQTRQRTKPDSSLTHDQVGSLGEVESESRREVRLLDERRVVDASRQHDDAGVPVQCDVGETIAQAVGERIERAERTARR